MSIRFFVATAFLALPRFALSAECFYPDGSNADTDIPCFRNDSLSRVCCAPNQVCSTNNLCVSKDASSPAQAFRGSCLDPKFGPSCPTFCTGSNKNGQAAMVSCGDPKAGAFCCDEGRGAECCATPSKVLILGVGTTFPEGASAASSMSMGTMMNPPAANSPQPLISMQSNTIISMSIPTSLSFGPSAQPAIIPPIPTQSAPTLPPIPSVSFGSAKGNEVLRTTSSGAAPTADSRASGQAAIIAGAESRTPALPSSPPLSAITIASAAIGGVLSVTLIIVVSVIVMRWRAATQEQNRQIQEASIGNEDGGGIKAGNSDGGSSARSQDAENGQLRSIGVGPQLANRGMAETGDSSGFVGMDRTRYAAPQAQYSETGAMYLQRETMPSQRQDEKRNMEGVPINAAENPFNRRISISPFDSPFDDSRDDDVLEYYAKRIPSPRENRSRRASGFEREPDMSRARFPDTAGPSLGRTSYDDQRENYSAMAEIPKALRVPAAGIERRVSRNSMDTMDSETYQKLVYGEQRRPF